MASAQQRRYNRVKGAMFEVIIKILLRKSGYKQLPPDPRYTRGDELRGRGAWHEIDAFGQYSYGIPFLFPIRLICEAKYYSTDKVGLPQVRNFLGAYKDIQEVYYIENYGQSTEVSTKRYSDAAAIFSANGFTTPAQDYAYAQGIRLISYESNPIFWNIIPLMEMCVDYLDIESASRNISDFKNWFGSFLDPTYSSPPYFRSYLTSEDTISFTHLRRVISDIRTSYLASARGLLPIHILSNMQIPWGQFSQTDQVPCEVYYTIEQPNSFKVKVRDNDFEFHFSVPKEFIDKYRVRLEKQNESRPLDRFLNEQSRMRSFKREVLPTIDVPVVHENVRRILSFALDKNWLDEYMI